MRGTYTLVLICKKSFRTKIGKLGYVNVGEGYYLYTGSALGEGAVSLEGRIRRHLRASKRRRWHVDYLTSNTNCTPKVAVFIESTKHLECSVNQAITSRLCVKPLLPHAGASDCKCEAHMMKVMAPVNERKIVRSLTDLYRVFGKLIGVSPHVVARSRALFPTCSGRRRGRSG